MSRLAPLGAPAHGRIVPLRSATRSPFWAHRDIEAAVDAAGIALRQGRLAEAIKQFAALAVLADDIAPEQGEQSWRLPTWVGLVAALAASGRWDAAAKVAREQFAALDRDELPDAFVTASAIAAQWLPEHGFGAVAPPAQPRETRNRRQPYRDLKATEAAHDPADDYAHALLTAIRFRLSRAAQSA